MLGEERIRRAEAQWSELIEQVRAEIDKGTDPASEQVRLLAKRWMELVHEFTGGNPEIEKSLRTMYRQETTIHSMETRSMREMMEYISRAMALLRSWSKTPSSNSPVCRVDLARWIAQRAGC